MKKYLTLREYGTYAVTVKNEPQLSEENTEFLEALYRIGAISNGILGAILYEFNIKDFRLHRPDNIRPFLRV